jgi:hypothetical protein
VSENETAEAQARRVIMWWTLTQTRSGLAIVDAMEEVLGWTHQATDRRRAVFNVIYRWKYKDRIKE